MASTTGKRIKDRRRDLGIGVQEMADKLGKNRTTVYRYESDAVEDMPYAVLQSLAEILHTTPAYLMGITDDPTDYSDPTLTEDIPLDWLREWREEGLSDTEIARRYLAVRAAQKTSPPSEEDELDQITRDTLSLLKTCTDDERRMYLNILRAMKAGGQPQA